MVKKSLSIDQILRKTKFEKLIICKQRYEILNFELFQKLLQLSKVLFIVARYPVLIKFGMWHYTMIAKELTLKNNSENPKKKILNDAARFLV